MSPINLVDPFGLDYADLNVTITPVGTVPGGAAGVIGGGGLGLVAGAVVGGASPTAGLMVDTTTGQTYIYIGGAATTNPFPKVDISLTSSGATPSSGGAITGTLSAVGVCQVGYGFQGGPFSETGLSNALGGSAAAYYAFGPYDIGTILNFLDAALIPYDLADGVYEDVSEFAGEAYKDISDYLKDLLGKRKKGS